VVVLESSKVIRIQSPKNNHPAVFDVFPSFAGGEL
jgi:hypothetical protein